MATVESAAPVQGRVAPGFEGVRAVVEDHLAQGVDIGVMVAATLDGEPIVDLWGGWADKKRTAPLAHDALIPIFSCSKAVSALVVATLVDQGALDYDRPVADDWPAFAAHGKGDLTLAQLMSHQAGLPGFADEWSVNAWYDWDAVTARLAADAPMWAPGSASGYHPITWGHLVDEVVRRATGRTIGEVLRGELAGPHHLDVVIGLDDAELERVVPVVKPPRPANLGELNAPTKAAFLMPWSSPAARGGEERWKRAAVASASGHAAARGLAALFEPFARGGLMGEDRVIAQDTVARATAERIAGPDLVLPYDLSWGAGLIRNTPERRFYGPGERTVGHTGSGGSCVMADPDRGLAFAYVMTKQSPELVSDARAQALIAAVYDAL